MISNGTRIKTQFLLSIAVCWLMDVVGEIKGPSILLPLTVSTFVWIMAAVGGWVMLTGGQRLLRRVGFRVPSALLSIGVTALLSLAIGLYLLDWSVFRQTGTFVEWEGLQFIGANFRELIYDIADVQSRDLLHVLIATLSIGLAILWLSIRLAPWFQKIESHLSIKKSLLFLVGAGLSASLFAYSIGFSGVPAGKTSLLYAAHHDTGPVAGFVVDGIEHLAYFRWVQPDKTKCASVLLSDAKKIIPMETYLKAQPPLKQLPYNVVYISIESLRADRLKCLGGSREVMPFLDRLAASSVVFSHAYSESTHTSFAETTGVTSQYPLRGNHVNWGDVPMAFHGVMLSNVLKALGYRTALFASQNMNWGGQRGLLKLGGLDTLMDADSFAKIAPGQTYRTVMSGKPANNKGEDWEMVVPDRLTLNAAGDWLKQNTHRPFFLYLNLQHSHFPYTVPAGTTPVFSPNEITFPVSFAHYPKEGVPVMINRYDNSLHYIDSLLEKFFGELEAMGLSDRTIVVISGDHGEAFWEHDEVTHAADPFNEVLHIPLIVHAPGLAPRIDPAPVQHIDIAPSVLHLLGLSPHPSFQGKDFFESGLGGGKLGESTMNRPIFTVVDTPLSRSESLIEDRYKLVSNWRTKTYALFDLETDPGERRNIFMDSPAVAQRLLKVMNFWTLCQVTYYEDSEVNSRYYPPSYDFSETSK